MFIKVLQIPILISSLVLAQLSFAYPTVGDFAEYAGKVEETNKTLKFIQQVELIDVDENSVFTKKITTLYDGQEPIVILAKVNKKDLVSEGYIKQTISYCNFMGGDLDRIKTEFLGYIQTCRTLSSTTNGSRLLWVADIPFGYAKTRITSKGDPSVMTLEIKRFHFGIVKN